MSQNKHKQKLVQSRKNDFAKSKLTQTTFIINSHHQYTYGYQTIIVVFKPFKMIDKDEKSNVFTISKTNKTIIKKTNTFTD